MKRTIMRNAMATATVAAVLLLASTAKAAFVTVGNPGNAPDPLTGRGTVGYQYNIGMYEVTAGEYTTFLNAVAATDAYGLYDAAMVAAPGNWNTGCMIVRSGASGSYTYSVAPDHVNRPVNMVSWYDAARYTNWLTTGNIQTGVYTFSGSTLSSVMDHQLAAVTYGTAYFLPTLNEWYKAAHYDPDKNGGAGGYWLYPTGADTQPGRDMAETTNPGNNANYILSNTYVLGNPYYRTEVGEFQLSDSPYGTFDQGGNVWEWTETKEGSWYWARGGSYHGGNPGSDRMLSSSTLNVINPTGFYGDLGFRIASMSYPIPEPASALLLGLAGVLLGSRRRRR